MIPRIGPPDPAKWASAVALFERMVDADAHERESILCELGETDQELYDIVARMLANDARADQLLDTGLGELAVMALDDGTLSVGARLGDFEVLSQLGHGGMGVVYRVRDVILGREAALKLLADTTPPHRAAVDRLVLEARAASALDHPNIATVYQIGEAANGRRFIAMPLYEGETLRERLKRGALPTKDALEIATQVARALAAAHEAGIVHRDVKPANIFLTRRGLVKLLDFGVAAVLGGSAELSSAGTALYMSPQQARGERPSPADDVWSLGVVLHEMIAGIPPFRGDSRSDVLGHITGSTPAPRLSSAFRVPAILQSVLTQALSKDPAERQQDGTVLLRALEQCARPSRRTATVRLIAAGLLLAIGATTVVATLRSGTGVTAPILAIGVVEAGPGGSRPDLIQVIPDMLADRLAEIPMLQVVSAERLHEIREQRPNGQQRRPAMEAAQRAGATELIEGTLHDLTDGRMRLELRRLDLESGVMKGTFVVDGTDPFAMVDEAARRLARTVGVLSTAASGSFPTRSLVAYRFYEEGLRAYYQGDGLGAHRLFEAAFIEDSTFAMALYYDRRARHAAGLLTAEADTMLDRLAALAKGRPERERLLIRAVWADATGQPNRLALAESLATRYPAIPDGHYLVGRARWSQLGDFLGAVPHFRRVLAMDSLSLRGGPVRCLACDALADMTAVYHLADSLPAAERTAREWVRLQPEAARAWVFLATTLKRQGRFEEALAARRRATPLQPGNRTDPVYPAIVAMQQGDWSAADVILRERLRTGPPMVRDGAGWYLAVSLRAQGRLREAQAIAREMSDRLAEAAVLVEMGQGGEAARIFDSLAAVAGPRVGYGMGPLRRSPWLLAHKATALAAAGDTGSLLPLATAIGAASRQWGGSRNQRLVHYPLGLRHAARGEFAQAERSYRNSVHSLTNGYNRLNLELARTLLVLDRPHEAVAVLQPALRGPFDGGNFYLAQTEINALLGRAFEAAGQPDSAAVHYQRVLSAWAGADPEFHARRDSIRTRLNHIRRHRVAAR